MVEQDILLISSGLSPQVITETLYYFHKSKEKINFSEVHVITDQNGWKLIDKHLLKGEQWFNKFFEDYQLDRSAVEFSKETIHVLMDKDGNPLNDLLTVSANSSAVNQIFDIIQKLTNDPKKRLITNIAGGRKTMSVIIGQAMQFYGKKEDLLTHVIIDERFLRLNDFYYPTPKSTFKIVQDEKIDYSKIKIILNELPYIRLKPLLGKLIDHTEDDSLKNLVSIAQKHINELIKPISISINRYDSSINIDNETLKFPKKNLAIYSALLNLIKNDYSEQNKEVGFIKIDNLIEENFLKDYLFFYEKLHSPFSVLVSKERDRINDKKERNKFYTLSWLQETRSKINRLLKDNLPAHIYVRSKVISSGKYGDKSYGLTIKKVSINLESFFNEQN